MKRIVPVLLLILGGCLAPAAFAQDHVEAGVYIDYFHLQQTKTDFAGVGGRFAINSSPSVQWEAEMSYDFTQPLVETFTSGATVTANRTNTRILTGLFGPKLETPRGKVRAFITVKGGGVNFRLDPRPATFSTFASSVDNLRAADVNGVFYPGGGLEGQIGPIGLRLDVGDEIYFASGTHNNLRVSFGPIIHF
jgi:hypothetical protein